MFPQSHFGSQLLSDELSYTPMTARPPPARPHIGIHPSNHFVSRSTADWGEDDAWDSTSDSESPRQTLSNSWNRPPTSSSTTTAPKPVPKPANNSSSTLAFSYTHLNAPDPSSYPPRTEVRDSAQAPKNGWTIVRKSHDRRRSQSIEGLEQPKQDSDHGQGDVDVEGDMILGDLDSEAPPDETLPTSALPPHLKPKKDLGSIKNDVDEIVNGTISASYISYTLFPHPVAMRH